MPVSVGSVGAGASRLQVPRSSENHGLYMSQIRSDTEVIQK